MRTQWTPPLEALERQAEAATALLTPLAEAATRRLQDLAEELEQAEAEALALNGKEGDCTKRETNTIRETRREKHS